MMPNCELLSLVSVDYSHKHIASYDSHLADFIAINNVWCLPVHFFTKLPVQLILTARANQLQSFVCSRPQKLLAFDWSSASIELVLLHEFSSHQSEATKCICATTAASIISSLVYMHCSILPVYDTKCITYVSVIPSIVTIMSGQIMWCMPISSICTLAADHITRINSGHPCKVTV